MSSIPLKVDWQKYKGKLVRNPLQDLPWTAPCICGSDKKFRDCCRLTMRKWVVPEHEKVFKAYVQGVIDEQNRSKRDKSGSSDDPRVGGAEPDSGASEGAV